MPSIESSPIAALIALAGIILGIALLVQVVQEVYKYLTSSKSRAYEQALIDFLGPLGHRLLQPGVLPDLRVRGPFQLKRLGPTGKLLPLPKDELIAALEQTAPPWVTRSLERLKIEAAFQTDGPAPASPSWNEFLDELADTERGSPGYWNALAIAEFLETWGHQIEAPANDDERTGTIGDITTPDRIDAAQMLVAFRQTFLPHVDDASERFPQFASNFDYAYQRRNTRHSFVIALFVAVLFNLPIEQIYHDAGQISTEEASTLVRNSIELYERSEALHAPSDTTAATDRTGPPETAPPTDTLMREYLELARAVSRDVLRRTETADSTNSILDITYVAGLYDRGWNAILRYLFGCLVTALLVSFGAPFWNDLGSALLRLQRGANLPAHKDMEKGNG